MQIIIEPSAAHGCVAVPASKSYAHRLLIGCALAQHGVSEISGLPECEDVSATIDCLKALNVEILHEAAHVLIHGYHLEEKVEPVFGCRESGSTLRFMIPIALAICGGGRFVCSKRLIERGISVYEELLSDKGVEFTHENGAISISGRLLPGEYEVPGDVSSQFITGLLFALPLLNGTSILRIRKPVESAQYIDMTYYILKKCGIQLIKNDQTYIIPGNQSYKAISSAVEGDWSSASFLYALNVLGGDVTVSGLNRNSLQSDRECLELFKRLRKGYSEMDIGNCPDLGPILFTVAAACSGGCFNGTRRLRIKESDRAAVMAEELRKFGADIDVYEDRVIVRSAELHRPAVPLDGHNDHRVVMSLAVLLTRYGGAIDGGEAVSKSYPAFFKALSSLGIVVKEGIV